MSSFEKIGDLICDLFGISLTEEPSQEKTKYIPYLKNILWKALITMLIFSVSSKKS